MPTYVYSPGSRSHHSSRHSHHGHSPSYHSGPHYAYPSSGYYDSSHGDGYGRHSAYDTGGSHRSREYYYPSSSSRSRSRSAHHVYPSGSYGAQYANPSRHGYRDQGNQNYAGSSRDYNSRSYRPTLGERFRWLFGMNHRDYHDSGKRSRANHESGRRHDSSGRHIYTV